MEAKMSGMSLQFLSLFMFIFLSKYMKNGFGLSLSEVDGNIDCIEKERQALLKIKEELTGDQGYLDSWWDEDCCRWDGISCSKQTGHVVSLNLTGRWSKGGNPYHKQTGQVVSVNLETRRYISYGALRRNSVPCYRRKLLKGNISDSLLELPHLNYLKLSSIDFGGQQIPEFIGSLHKLEHLDLSAANLRGRVPYQLKNLSRLQSLDLSSNFGLYATKLEWLSGMSSLKQLFLNHVDLSESTDWVQVISGLPSLTKLRLRDCNLPSVLTSPVSFVNSFKSLSSLDLSGNNLSNSIYLWLFHYSSSLAHLALNNNNLQGTLPNAFCNMTSLSYLYLNENQIDGVPNCFSNMCALKALHLDSNNITGQLSVFFLNLSGCTRDSLEILSLYNNSLTGPLPHFTSFLSMIRLDVGKNQLNGTVTKSIGELSKLEYLDLSSNSLQDIITEAHLSNLSRLIYMDLSFNSLTLKFSTGWTPPFQLEQILLASCKQGHRFPKWLQSQYGALSLDISNAGILDTIPNWFWDLYKLEKFNLSNNQLIGVLPDLSSGPYERIDLSFNRLEGPIPMVSSYVAHLILSKNKFFGSISFLCDSHVSGLVYLDLSDNQLSGDIPDCLMYQQDLQVLNLANNNFSGKIPDKIESNCRIWSLDLHNNSLTGELPSSLKNCKELTIMDVGDNKLFGTIPSWIGDIIPNLTILSLRSNQFYGNMPIQLCNLTAIQILDLSQNNISGTIPKCLNNLIALVQIANSNATIEHSITSSSYCGVISYLYSYQGNIFLIWKGTFSKFSSILGLVKIIDFSSNRLSGSIPKEITSLVGLISLNLSRNDLIGLIPKEIGNLKRLDALDLSENRLTGKIPESLLSQLDFLGVLNLSINNLSGKIPLTTKSQTFTASSYMRNPNLCGFPLPNKCSEDEVTHDPFITISDNEEGLVTRGFYTSMILGFIIGFWGVVGTLVLKESWRYAYFQFLNNMKDKLYILVALNMAKIQRKSTS